VEHFPENGADRSGGPEQVLHFKDHKCWGTDKPASIKIVFEIPPDSEESKALFEWRRLGVMNLIKTVFEKLAPQYDVPALKKVVQQATVLFRGQETNTAAVDPSFSNNEEEEDAEDFNFWPSLEKKLEELDGHKNNINRFRYLEYRPSAYASDYHAVKYLIPMFRESLQCSAEKAESKKEEADSGEEETTIFHAVKSSKDKTRTNSTPSKKEGREADIKNKVINQQIIAFCREKFNSMDKRPSNLREDDILTLLLADLTKQLLHFEEPLKLLNDHMHQFWHALPIEKINGKRYPMGDFVYEKLFGVTGHWDFYCIKSVQCETYKKAWINAYNDSRKDGEVKFSASKEQKDKDYYDGGHPADTRAKCTRAGCEFIREGINK
jgi:hypothetical protein